MNATFYDFVGIRKDNDIDELWSLFEIAIKYSIEKVNIIKINLYVILISL